MPIQLNGVTIFDENNIKLSLPLFFSTWFDYLLNDANYLRADTFSWQSGSMYTSAYQHLVADISGITSETETISGTTITFYRATDGHKIVLADQESNVSAIYTATGVAWYYILDTVNTRFKLPRMLPLGDTAPVVGNGMALGLTDGTNLAGLASFGSGAENNKGGYLRPVTTSYGLNVGDTSDDITTTNRLTTRIVAGVTNDPTKSGLISNLSHTANDGAYKYLYFYVGNTVQGQTTIDVGQITEALNYKSDTDLANITSDGKQCIVTNVMPDYENVVSVDGITAGVYTQVVKDSFVVTWGPDPYTEDYYVYVSPDNGTTKYIVGRRFDDENGQTEEISFSFFVPKGWYFTNKVEHGYSARIYPLKGAQ